MEIAQFIDDIQVREAILQTGNYISSKNIFFSDVKDSFGNQYVDLVQSGGGALGFALLGYVYAMEELGIRFISLGGTSAGALSSALLGAVDVPQNKRALTVLEELLNLEINKFIDGGNDAQALIAGLSQKSTKLGIVYNAFRQVDDLLFRKEKGINRGHELFGWIESVLHRHGVANTNDLLTRMNSFDDSLSINLPVANIKENSIDIKAKLSVFAADITTYTKAEFPAMNDLYFMKPDKISPAVYIHASMAVPFLFDPVKVCPLPDDSHVISRWRSAKTAFYRGDIPREVELVDGGILSNFPIDVFHVWDRLPTRPTFGAHLGQNRTKPSLTSSVKDVLWQSFNASRRIRDQEAFIRDPELFRLVAHIHDGDIPWFNLQLSDNEKIQLFKNGVFAACRFLKIFDWPAYKRLRSRKLTNIHNDNHADIGAIYMDNLYT